MVAVSRGQRHLSFAGYLSQRPPQQRSAHLQGALFPGGEGASREEDRCLRRFLQRAREKIVRHQADFFVLPGGGRHGVGGAGEELHKSGIWVLVLGCKGRLSCGSGIWYLVFGCKGRTVSPTPVLPRSSRQS